MSHQSPAIRSSHSSRRYSPYSRPPHLTSAHPLPSHSPERHCFLLSDHHLENDVSLASAHSQSFMNSMTGYHPVPPFPIFQSLDTTQPSASIHPQLEPSTHVTCSLPSLLQQSTHLSQFPHHDHGLYPRPNPATNTAPHPTRLLQTPQFLNVQQPSITIHRPEDLNYLDYSIHQLPFQEQVPGRQGSTYYGKGMFSNSHNLTIPNGTFIDNSVVSDNFMQQFLQHTIIGAEFDSSDRHPPPRCHPGTRLAIVERCKIFIAQCNGKEKIRWVVGPAGVGKSAIMQIVAEETPADASVFFSVNGRQDGTKIFTTISYQLAVKYEPYRQFIQKEVSHDPSLLRKALPVQFRKLIVDPFIHRRLSNPSRRFLIIIDGLDECDNPLTQQELLELISDFCLSYPSSPIVWFIAGRPVPCITSFFDDARVAPVYTKEEITIDSDEACEDVQRYLRDGLNKIKLAYPTLRSKREWPSELEFTKIATAAGGLFAYASTVVRYIGDHHHQDPTTQLRRVLEVIDASPKDDLAGRDHPMAQLDALYKRILSNIPIGVMANAKKLLLIMHPDYFWWEKAFRWQCNNLGMTEDAAYAAVRHLHAVVKVPAPDKADNAKLSFFHKSFSDFLCDFKRSGFFLHYGDEANQLLAESSFRIVKQVPDNFDATADEVCYQYGYVKSGHGFCDDISLCWSGDDRFLVTDDQLKLSLYIGAMATVCKFFEPYKGISWFQVLTTRFTVHKHSFPVYLLREAMFGRLRAELTQRGQLKQVPLRALDYAAICGNIDVQFLRPNRTEINHLDPWNLTCQHKRCRLRRGWSTSFRRFLYPSDYGLSISDTHWFNTSAIRDSHLMVGDIGEYECLYCSLHFARHFINNPNQLATIFVDSSELCYVELCYVDADDGLSKWRYRFCHSGPSSCVE